MKNENTNFNKLIHIKSHKLLKFIKLHFPHNVENVKYVLKQKQNRNSKKKTNGNEEFY